MCTAARNSNGGEEHQICLGYVCPDLKSQEKKEKKGRLVIICLVPLSHP